MSNDKSGPSVKHLQHSKSESELWLRRHSKMIKRRRQLILGSIETISSSSSIDSFAGDDINDDCCNNVPVSSNNVRPKLIKRRNSWSNNNTNANSSSNTNNNSLTKRVDEWLQRECYRNVMDNCNTSQPPWPCCSEMRCDNSSPLNNDHHTISQVTCKVSNSPEPNQVCQTRRPANSIYLNVNNALQTGNNQTDQSFDDDELMGKMSNTDAVQRTITAPTTTVTKTSNLCSLSTSAGSPTSNQVNVFVPRTYHINAKNKRMSNPRIHSMQGLTRAKIKTVKITLVVITCYVLCSSPFICVQLWAQWWPNAQQTSIWSGMPCSIFHLQQQNFLNKTK